MTLYWFAIAAWAFLVPCQAPATEPAIVPSFTYTEDVIYGRKYGTALTMDVYTPTQAPNGAALIWVVSGGWVSGHGAKSDRYNEFLRRGYTVFAVVHGSQPKYTIPEILEDMHLAIRFIRLNANRFHIDPDRIGIMGGSAGGHLSLMMGLDQQPGKPKKKDPLEREPSRVQAVACFFPPTDFLNYGSAGRDVFQAFKEELQPFQAPFDFHEFDKESKLFVPITDEQRRMNILRQISPITHVSADDPPVLIIHGNADKLVPLEQSERLIDRLKAAGVTAKLIVKPGAKHGWPELQKDLSVFADWFDQYLQKNPDTKPN